VTSCKFNQETARLTAGFFMGKTMSDGGVLADYFTEGELAKQLRKDVRTLQRWRVQRKGPPPTLIGRDIYYRKSAVRDWLLSCETKMPRESKRAA
jgi:Helix-turn-helix domain